MLDTAPGPVARSVQALAGAGRVSGSVFLDAALRRRGEAEPGRCRRIRRVGAQSRAATDTDTRGLGHPRPDVSVWMKIGLIGHVRADGNCSTLPVFTRQYPAANGGALECCIQANSPCLRTASGTRTSVLVLPQQT